MTNEIPHIRVFISSPGDVAQERGIASQLITNLNFHPDVKGKFFLEPLRWDDPKVTVPLSGVETPQKSVNRYLVKPSECDLVVVLLWSRLGSPLNFNGRDYLSGTHYELMDALEQAEAHDGVPEVWVYRRQQAPSIQLDDPRRDELIAQWQAVDKFFEDYTRGNERGFNGYDTPDDFGSQLEGQILSYLRFMEKNPDRVQVYTDEELSLWVGSPFPGLRTYTEEDAPIFFGRGAIVDKLLDKMYDSFLIAIMGVSGSGKSSLVRAGLIPRLRDDAIEGSSQWKINVMRVGDDPIANLIEACDDLELSAETLRTTSSALHDALIAKDESTRLLIIDQFEEVFTRVSEKDCQAFLAILSHASSYLRIILTVRADFYHRLLPHLEDALVNGQFPLTKPSSFALLEMVTRPAELAGLIFEEGLPERIVADTGDTAGGLALMAYLLAELYNEQVDNKLTTAAYEQIGAVQGAIAKRADSIYKSLPSKSQSILPKMIRNLADINETNSVTRRRVLIETLQEQFSEDEFNAVQNLISAFVEARLLVIGSDIKKRQYVEVAHEALLTSWQLVQQQLDKDRSFLIWRRMLLRDVEQWIDYNFDSNFLFSGVALEEARDYQKRYPDEIPEEAISFLQHSEQRHRNQQIIRFSLIAVMAIISIVAISSFAQAQWRKWQASSPMASYSNPQLLGYTDTPLNVPAFRIEKEEVSVAEYRLCMTAGVCTAPSADTFSDSINDIENEQLPITMVTAYQAHQFCAWIGRRLPTSAEWEYAAQGSNQRNYPWSDGADPSPERVNLYHEYEGGVYDPENLVAVNDMAFSAGATDEGVMHLLGNVAEWIGTPYIVDEDCEYCGVINTDEATNKSVSDCTEGCLEKWDGETPYRLPVRGRSWDNWDLIEEESDIALAYVAITQPNRTSTSIGFRCAADGN